MKKKVVMRETSMVLLIGLLLAILRWLPTRMYNRMLNVLMNTIHPEVMAGYAQDFVDIVKLSRKVSREYSNSELETLDLKRLFVCLKPVYPMLASNVRNHRKKVGLPL